MQKQKVNIKNKFSELTKTSVILYAFRVAAAWLYFNLAHGFFGRLFTCYDKEEEILERSVTGLCLGSVPGKKTLGRRIRRRIAVAFENSGVLSWLGRLPNWLLGLSTRTYGVFGIVFGVYTIMMTLLRLLIQDSTVSPAAFITGCISVLASIPLMMRRIPLAQALREGAVGRTVLIKLLDVHEDKLYPKNISQSPRHSTAILAGMILGTATYFVSPLVILGVIAMVLAMWLVLALPEVGIMALLATTPFLSLFRTPTIVLAGGVALTTVSYIIKFLRGKRNMRFRLVSIFVTLFSFIILFGGVISAGGGESLHSALIYFVLLQGFNLTVNLFRTREDCRHAFNVLTVSGVITAFYGVIQYFIGGATLDWVDTEMFAYIEGRATSFFDNPNVLGAYLILIFPLILVSLLYSEGFKRKFLSVVAVAVAVICLVWTWSRGAWLGVLVGTVIFFIIYSHKTLQVLFACGLSLPLVGILLPHSVVDRFLSIGNMSDSSTYYRVFTWRGASNMIGRVWASGVGVGPAAFQQVFPLFAHAGVEASPHAHNLWLQVTSEVGVVGLAVLMIVFVLFAQICLGSINKFSPRERMTVSAGMCGIISALVMGLADNIWYNYRVFFVFWCVMALTVAYVNAITSERSELHEVATPDSAHIHINIIE